MGTKTSGRSSRSLDPKQLRNFRKESSPKVDEVFKRTMKIVEETIKRLEYTMFSDDFWDAEKNVGKFNSSLASQVKGLGQVLANLGSLYIRIQKEAKEAANLMTFQEKLEAITSFGQGLGRVQTAHFLKALYPVIYELESRVKSRGSKKELKDALTESKAYTDPPSDG